MIDKQHCPQPIGCVWAVDYLTGFRPSTVETLASTLKRGGLQPPWDRRETHVRPVVGEHRRHRE
jgi:hypothetical protein